MADRRVSVPEITGVSCQADTEFAVKARLAGWRLLRVRLPAIALATVGLLAFGSLFRRVSPRVGLAATLLLGGAWPYLAHSHYVTTDTAPVVFLILTCWAVVRYPGWRGAAAAGVFLAGALLSKFSAPYLAPFVLGFAFIRLERKHFALLLAVGAATFFAVESYAIRTMTTSDVLALGQRAFDPGGLEGSLTAPSPFLLGITNPIVRESRPGPVVYVSLLVYREPGWKSLFPGLAAETPDSGSYLVDRLAFDLQNAARRHPVIPGPDRTELAVLRKFTSRIDWLQKVGRRVPAREPTFVLYEIDPARRGRLPAPPG